VPKRFVSQFLSERFIIHSYLAAANPWMIFVDNVYQENDIYDKLTDNF